MTACGGLSRKFPSVATKIIARRTPLVRRNRNPSRSSAMYFRASRVSLFTAAHREGTPKAITSPLRAVTVSADDLQMIEEEMPEIAGQLRSIMAAREREVGGPREC
jgi:hypothetical protein